MQTTTKSISKGGGGKEGNDDHGEHDQPKLSKSAKKKAKRKAKQQSLAAEEQTPAAGGAKRKAHMHFPSGTTADTESGSSHARAGESSDENGDWLDRDGRPMETPDPGNTQRKLQLSTTVKTARNTHARGDRDSPNHPDPSHTEPTGDPGAEHDEGAEGDEEEDEGEVGDVEETKDDAHIPPPTEERDPTLGFRV